MYQTLLLETNPADLFTKNLGREILRLIRWINIHQIYFISSMSRARSCATHITAVRIRIRTLVDLSTNCTRNRKGTLVPGTTSVDRLSTPVVAADGERPQADPAV